MHTSGRFKIGAPVLLFVICLIGGLISSEKGFSATPDLTNIEQQLFDLSTFDKESEKLLGNYLASEKKSIPNEIKVLVKLLDTLMLDYAPTSQQDHSKYLSVQNHIKWILHGLIPIVDRMSGSQIQSVLKLLNNSDLILSEAVLPQVEKFSQAISSPLFDVNLLPAVLQKQSGLVLSELVRESLVERWVSDQLKFHGQDEAYSKILMTMVRPHTHFPILVEPSFAGKTEFVLDLTRRLMMRDYPPNPLFQKSFKDAVVLYLSGGKMDKAAVHATLEALTQLKATAQRPLIVVIENLHLLSSPARSSLEDFMAGIQHLTSDKLKFIATTTPEGFEALRKDIGADEISATVEKINLAPLSLEDFIKVTQERIVTNPAIVEELGVKFEKGAIDRLARMVLEEKETTQTPFYRMRALVEDIAVNTLATDPWSDGVITSKDVRSYINKRAGISFSPDDPKETAAYYGELEAKISKEIAGQDRMIREVLDMHRDLMVNSNGKRPLRVVGIVGPTGVGKTELAKVLARHAYGHTSNSLRVDGTAYMDKANLWKLLGPTVGYKDSEQKGQLIEYLEGPGKNGGVILIDEGEKACPEFWQAMMSLFEEGFVIGGDGKPRFLHNHLVVITSNRGDKQLYPKGFEEWTKDQQKTHIEGFKQDQLKGLFTQSTGNSKDTLFPDYIIQRIDHFVAANQADLGVALEFIPKLASRLKENIFETYGKVLTISDELLETYVRSNFKATSGYRPLFRAFEFNFKKIVLDCLAKMNPEDNNLTLNLGANADGKVIQGEYSDKSAPLEFEFPTSEEDSVFRDPHIFDRLAKLPELIKKSIIGQDHIIDPLVAAVQKHVIKSQGARRAPLAFFTIGPTGTGKTELAKVLALGLLGSSDRVGIIPMGEINSRSKWANYFGGDVGYQGSDVMRLFEQILRSNPQGGVIVLDEASNVGGQDRELKTELLKLLYNMIEEGKWVSPTTGIEYDLSKYIFLLTGNDGQELYHGATDENLREATWARNNKPERIMEILVNSGVPQPLLGRMASLFWSRPLNKTEMTIVAQKFMESLRLDSETRKIKIAFENHFVQDLVAHSYSVMMGARSVRNFIENAIGGLLAQIEIKAFENKINLIGSTVNLSFGDSKKRLPIVNSKTKEGPEVFLHGLVESAEFPPFEQTLSTKGFLAPHGTQTQKQAYETAIHEGGHAIVNDYARVGLKILSITVDASGGHLGYVNYEDNPHLNWNRERVIARIASTFAGGLAQQMAGIGLDGGWSSDLQTARTFATQAIVQWGLGQKLDSIFYPQEKDGKPQINPQVLEREVDAIMQEAYDLSKKTLAENWKTLLLVAKKLMKQYTLNHEEWENLKTERVRGKVQYERVTEQGVDQMKPIRVKKTQTCAGSLR